MAAIRYTRPGILKQLDRVSRVSGGSITAGVLALAWSKLSFQAEAVRDDFVPLVVHPLRRVVWPASSDHL